MGAALWQHAVEVKTELHDLVADPDVTIVFNGHTHRRMVRHFPGLTIVNAGTLDRNQEPRVVVVDPETGEVSWPLPLRSGSMHRHSARPGLRRELGPILLVATCGAVRSLLLNADSQTLEPGRTLLQESRHAFPAVVGRHGPDHVPARLFIGSHDGLFDLRVERRLARCNSNG